MYNSTISPKYGQCIDCIEHRGDFGDKDLIAGRCQYHYRVHKAKEQSKKQRLKQQVRKLGVQNQRSPQFNQIKKVSDKLKANLEIYNILRKDFLADHKFCEAKLVGCKGKATEVHHRKGRLANLNEVSTFVAVCRVCHVFIELNPILAKELGLSENRLT